MVKKLLTVPVGSLLFSGWFYWVVCASSFLFWFHPFWLQLLLL